MRQQALSVTPVLRSKYRGFIDAVNLFRGHKDREPYLRFHKPLK